MIGAFHINERLLYQQVKRIFPGYNIEINVKKNADIKFPVSGAFMEFDLWLPELNLCFEFQDPHHYDDTCWYKHVPILQVQAYDYIKKERAHQSGLSLVEVPCWWDGLVQSLVASIVFQRPDISIYNMTCLNDDASPPNDYVSAPVTGTFHEDIKISLMNNPQAYFREYALISLNPPTNFFKRDRLPGVGTLMLASFPQLIPKHCSWWMGEKYDGVRCYWHEPSKFAYSRQGRPIPLLPSVLDQLPRCNIDSELWFGRGEFPLSFMLISGTVTNWPQFRVVTFDAPQIHTLDSPAEYDRPKNPELYETRYTKLLRKVAADHPFNHIVPRMRVRGHGSVHYSTEDLAHPMQPHARMDRLELGEHVANMLHQIIGSGGEGIILQQELSRYDIGRSESLLKLKSVQSDHEGIIVGEQNNSLLLRLPDNTTISVPPENIQVTPSPRVGDIVSFAYGHPSQSGHEETHLNPAIIHHAIVLRVRDDLKLSDLGFDHIDGTLTSGHLLEPKEKKNQHKMMSILKKGYHKAVNYLFPNGRPRIEEEARPIPSYVEVENRKKFFEIYASKQQIDPLNPHQWYLQSLSSLMSEKGIHSVIAYHSNSVSKALVDLFPEIGLERSKFKEHKYEWIPEDTRRGFFEMYAKDNDFDPLVASNWYAQPISKILKTRGSQSVIFYHKCSVVEALIDLFPDVDIDKSKFGRNTYERMETRRAHFETYARNRGFDPNVPASWYAIQPRDIMNVKGTRNILVYHGNSLSQALLELFPNMGLDRSKFSFRQRYWTDLNNRRQFFELYAREKNFDPLLADNWHVQNIAEIMATKGAKSITSYYGSIPNALAELFPDIRTDKSLFISDHHAWEKVEIRQMFFEKYAQSLGFDPLNPENWYIQTKHKIMAFQGAHSVLSYHSYSIPQALVDLFPDIGLNRSHFHSL